MEQYVKKTWEGGGEGRREQMTIKDLPSTVRPLSRVHFYMVAHYKKNGQ